MRQVSIPNTDLRVSEICLGTGPFGGDVSRSDSFALLDAFVERGGTFIDTAHIYNDWIPGEKSRSEKVIGAWMKERGNRDQVVIGTKGAHPFMQSMLTPRLSPQEIIGDLDESLAFLQLDTIAIYWLHRDDRSRPVAEILETLNSQVKAGKIRYFGVSNWEADRLREAQEYAARAGLQAFCANQVLWNAAVIDHDGMPDKTMVAMNPKLLTYHREHHFPAVAYTSQAMGLFDRLDQGTYEKLGPGAQKTYPEAPNYARLERIRKVAAETGKTINQIVLAYLLNQPFTTIAIIGTRQIAHMDASMQASGVILTAEQLDFLAG